jgi:hypothetical protein
VPMEPGSASATAERRVLYRKQASQPKPAEPVLFGDRLFSFMPTYLPKILSAFASIFFLPAALSLP